MTVKSMDQKDFRLKRSTSKGEDFTANMAGFMVAKSEEGKALLEELQDYLHQPENEICLFYYLSKNFGSPIPVHYGNNRQGLSWELKVNKKFDFCMDYGDNGFEAMFDCTHIGYKTREKFIAWVFKKLKTEAGKLAKKPVEKLLTSEVRKLVKDTISFDRIKVLGPTEFPTCFFCRKEFHIRPVETVVPDLHPEQKQKLASMELNKVICPECGFASIFFPAGFKYMDKNGLTITIYKNNEECNDYIKLLKEKEEKSLIEFRENSWAELGDNSFSLHGTDPRLIPEYIKNFDGYMQALAQEYSDKSLQKSVRHNYKKFYYSNALGNKENAYKFLRCSTQLHATNNRLEPDDKEFFGIIGKTRGKLAATEDESIFLRFYSGLVKTGKIDERMQKSFPKQYNDAMTSYVFGVSLESLENLPQ